MYMLDTDICIYIIKRKPRSVLKRLESLQPGQLALSAITFAAHALSLDLILVSNNEKEFKRVDGLKIENWI